MEANEKQEETTDNSTRGEYGRMRRRRRER
jgi:hypothetical protein